MNIVVLDGHTLNPGDNPWDDLASLGALAVHDRTADEDVIDRAIDAEILFTNKTPLPKEVIAQLPNLRMIGVMATGYNIVDVEAARNRDIPVCNIPVYGTDSVAQYVFAQLLEFCHHLPLHDAAVRKGRWAEVQEFSFWETDLIELVGKTMGVVGFGRIGRRVGELANAFGMDVVAFDVYQGEPPPYDSFQWLSIEKLFEQSDVVSLHCNQTDDNFEFVNKNLLKRMKPTALLVNAARGGLVHEQDLADALNSGTLAGAALDVTSKEPIDPNNPLLKAKNAIITPHIAWATLAARKRLMHTAFENAKMFLEGTPSNVVN